MESYHNYDTDKAIQNLYEHFHTSPHYFFTKRDLEGRYTYANPAYAKRFEFLNKNLVGEEFTATVYGKTDIDKMRAAIKQLIENPNELIYIKIRKVKPNNDWWWIFWELSAVKDDAGNVVEIISIGYDVTENHRNELKALEYSIKVSNILESITDGFFVLSHTWAILKINHVFENTFNKKAENLIGENFWDLFPSTDDYNYPKAYRKAMENREPVRFEEFFDNRWFLINVYPSLDGISVFFQDTTERKLAAEKLKESEIKLKSMLNSTTSMNVLIDKRYRVLLANQVAQKNVLAFHGKELREGDDFRQYIISDDRIKDFEKNVVSALAGQEILLEKTIGVGSEPNKWYQYHYFPVYDHDNSIVGVNLNVIDIDEKKQQQELLKQNEIKLKSVLNSTNQMNFLFDKNYKVLLANKEAEKYILDIHKKELKEGDDFRQYITNEGGIESFEKHIQMALTGKEASTDRQIGIGQAPQKWYQYRYFPVYDHDANVVGVDLNITDIDLQKTQQEQLKERELRLQAILDSTTDLNILLSLDGKIISFNREAHKHFFAFMGKELQEELDFIDFVIPERRDIFKQDFQKALTGELLSVEVDTLYKDNLRTWHLIRYFPVYDAHNHLVAISFNSSNITEQKEKELKILVQNEQLKEIAWIQSHQLRRPVATILGLIGLVNMENEVSQEVKDYIRYLQEATQELDAVIHQIVDKTYQIED